MSGNAFGGYSKPNFEVKNLTSDMWEPISTTNNYSAYTPERPAAKSSDSVNRTRQPQQKKTAPAPAKEAIAKKKSPLKKDSGILKNKKASQKQKVNTESEPKAKPKEKIKSQAQDRPISSGRVPQPTKEKKIKSPTKRQINLREKRRQKINQAYVRLIKKGKTADQARVILMRRKIRLKRIKTFGTVVFFFLFAMSFMLSFSYYQGAEISEIIVKIPTLL